MLNRPGGTAYIENTLMTTFMRHDAGVDLEDSYPPKEISKISRSGNHRLLYYLANDMVIHINSLVP